MNTPYPRNRAQHLHGQGPPISRRTTAAVLLLVLGIVMKTAPGSAQLSSMHRVVGGQDAAPRERPWQAALLYEGSFFCGGSLISQDWVVTAAHCVVRKTHRKLQVLLGVLNLMDTGPTKLSVAVKKIIINPIYNGGITSGDLALLELEISVNFNDNIQPITLPSQDQEFQNGMMCWLTGWGYTVQNVPQSAPNTLQEVKLPLINSTNCDKMFQVASHASHAPDLVKEDMICAGYPEGKKDGCQGDSGGPLACPSNESWFLVGIVSWGEGCAQPQKPGVYTKVSSFSSWIQEWTGAITISKLKTTAATTENVNRVITQNLKVESQAFTLSKMTNQETTSAGRRLQISISLFVMVITLTGIVDVAREAFLCL
ncbi:serine protease 33-like [Bufo bufo]|uniref:serine protease 33-like n=1 Tax=Bufo bufo TaxID=8384 RepID=UPI001ABE56EF|nr:serine protease 33-like [Bufo bufo]